MLMRRSSSEPAGSRRRRVPSQGECHATTAVTLRGTVGDTAAAASCSRECASAQTSPPVLGRACAGTNGGPSGGSSDGPSTGWTVARPRRAPLQHCSSELRRHYSLPRPSTQTNIVDVDVDVDTTEPWLPMGWGEQGVTSWTPAGGPHDEMVVRGQALPSPEVRETHQQRVILLKVRSR